MYDAARVVLLSAGEVNMLSYERWHGRQILGGLASNRRYRGLSEAKARPAAQLFFCIDEREESMRRALEEIGPEVETFSAAGSLAYGGLQGDRRPA
jgi:hypothetical protein